MPKNGPLSVPGQIQPDWDERNSMIVVFLYGSTAFFLSVRGKQIIRERFGGTGGTNPGGFRIFSRVRQKKRTDPTRSRPLG